MNEMELIDIWRIQNPLKLQYSRREMSKSGLVQSRIDFWLISTALQYQIKRSSIKPGNSSDHSLVIIKMECLDTQKSGKGVWKFNNSLLHDLNFVKRIKETIANLKKYVKMYNKAMLWDFVKCKVRSETIDYSIRKSRENKQKETKLANRLIHLENSLHYNKDNYNEYLTVKEEWENCQKIKLQGSIIRSKVKWVEE